MWNHRFERRTIALLEFPSFDVSFASQISPDGMIGSKALHTTRPSWISYINMSVTNFLSVMSHDVAKAWVGDFGAFWI